MTNNTQTIPTETETAPATFNLQPATPEAPMREPQHLSISIESARLATEPAVVCIAELPSGSARRASRPHVRNGKIARLPKLHRDMVNRMLYNNVPYRKIVQALDECNVQVTERNISNWKTRGGYSEWREEQERQLQLAHLQDHLTDYIRKNNATQLPGVGLQVAATQLSFSLLQPDTARQLAADPQKYSRIVDMLCRLATHINTLQKDRNEAVEKAATRNTSEFVRREEEKTVENIRWTWTSALGERPGEETPYRNDLPPRDEMPWRDPSPESPALREILQCMAEMKSAKSSKQAVPSDTLQDRIVK